MAHYNKTVEIVSKLLKEEKYKGIEGNRIRIKDLMFALQCRAEYAYQKLKKGYGYRYPYLGIFKPSGSKTSERKFARSKNEEEWKLKEEYDRNKIVMGKIKREQYIKEGE